ncbi:MAG TPA: hypothetical protein VL403_05060 [Candidatus Kryptonia bacterium]|nr:hypothetical protein [Candidatus Kryptonia bacterium]
MRYIPDGGFSKLVLIAAVVVGAAVGVHAVTSSSVPAALTHSFEFPVSLGSAVSGDLVSPIGGTPSLTFDHGTVAVGMLPVPLPQPLARLKQLRNQPVFFMPANDATPHARLLLSGVVDANGAAVTNSGNQLVIDAVVSPGSAVTTLPPFIVPFDINDGMAFIDAALPIEPQSDGAVTVQVTAISVSDPSGQLFGVLGFHLAPVVPTATPFATHTPGGTPSTQGQCFVSPNCMGPSFPAPQDLCCHFTRPTTAATLATSWCPPSQFDPQTGQCNVNACVACGSSSGDCAARTTCDGVCNLTCADGRVVVGKCESGSSCGCSADCTLPPTTTPAPTGTPGPCDASASCGGTCPFKCADGTTVIGQCAVLLTPNEPRGPICACEGQCPQPASPTPDPNGCEGRSICGGSCTGTCSDGSVATGKCQPTIFNGPIILPGSSPIPPGAACQCVPDCPQPPTPTPGVCGANGLCGGTCTATCPDGTTETGKCGGFDPSSPLGGFNCRCIAPCNQPTPPPTFTPGRNVCDQNATCSGSCPFTCPDGTTVTGKCVGLPISVNGQLDLCSCLADCGAPPPPTFPPLPHGTICCQCGAAANKCFELNWIEVTPSCPAGCQTILNGTCDSSGSTCVPPTPMPQ